ncbi:Amino acid racemase [Sulfidibacter corallicola]|uniref:Amino acid racemase n=1 Tax=Sulfidibacter corallicola TaxID=2818388 RepID=A0A8A4THD4_SULCO|nr:amino acid racemase [Sulfidibacter corallicola]QTD48158.1 amino acid racemase [Sulfidibacter corallicola]
MEPFSSRFMEGRRIVGILGGMSGESTLTFLRDLYDEARRLAGGTHLCETLMYSVDFYNIETFVHAERWEEAAHYVVDKGRRLEAAGADFLVIVCNTMHKVAPQLEAAVSIPLLHIADPTGEAVAAAGARRIALMGTLNLMRDQEYQDRFRRYYDLDVLLPQHEEQVEIHRILFEELCRGVILPESKAILLTIMDRLVSRGAESIVLGCTELEMLVKAKDYPRVPVFDTMALLARKSAALSVGIDRWDRLTARRPRELTDV